MLDLAKAVVCAIIMVLIIRFGVELLFEQLGLNG